MASLSSKMMAGVLVAVLKHFIYLYKVEWQTIFHSSQCTGGKHEEGGKKVDDFIFACFSVYWCQRSVLFTFTNQTSLEIFVFKSLQVIITSLELNHGLGSFVYRFEIISFLLLEDSCSLQLPGLLQRKTSSKQNHNDSYTAFAIARSYK